MRILFVLLLTGVMLFSSVFSGGPQPTPAAEKVTLKLVSFVPTNNPLNNFVRVYGDKVSEVSGGMVKIKHIGGPEVIVGGDQFRGVATGVVDMGWFDIGRSPEVPLAAVWTYFIDPEAQDDFFFEGGWKELLNEMAAEKNVMCLGVAMFPSSVNMPFTVKDKPISKLADLRGLKINVPGTGEVFQKIFKPLGIIAVPGVAKSEIYGGLQTGVLDGIVQQPVAIRTFKLNEVVRHCITFHLPISPIQFVINLDSWNRLSPANQKFLVDGYEAAKPVLREMQVKSIESDWDWMRTESGIEIAELSAEDKAVQDQIYWKLLTDTVAGSPYEKRILDMAKPYFK